MPRPRCKPWPPDPNQTASGKPGAVQKAWLFAGSDRGAERAALIASLIATAKLNEVDPQAWLADVLARIAGHPAQHLDALLPWHWQQQSDDQISAEAA